MVRLILPVPAINLVEPATVKLVPDAWPISLLVAEVLSCNMPVAVIFPTVRLLALLIFTLVALRIDSVPDRLLPLLASMISPVPELKVVEPATVRAVPAPCDTLPLTDDESSRNVPAVVTFPKVKLLALLIFTLVALRTDSVPDRLLPLLASVILPVPAINVVEPAIVRAVPAPCVTLPLADEESSHTVPVAVTFPKVKLLALVIFTLEALSTDSLPDTLLPLLVSVILLAPASNNTLPDPAIAVLAAILRPMLFVEAPERAIFPVTAIVVLVVELLCKYIP